jgi:hypothetical protein
MPKNLPDADFLKEILEYNPETGALTWRKRGPAIFGGNEHRCKIWNARMAGKPALNFKGNQGYLVGNMRNVGGVKAHRVIWKMVHGTEPECIDHINGVRDDNRICNLRSVTPEENAKNPGLSANNTSGSNGVYWYPRYGKWMASIRVNGKRKNLGYFAEKEAAIEARRSADVNAGYSTWRNR